MLDAALCLRKQDQEHDFRMAHPWLKLITRYRFDQRLQLITLNNSSTLEMRETTEKKIYNQWDQEGNRLYQALQ